MSTEAKHQRAKNAMFTTLSKKAAVDEDPERERPVPRAIQAEREFLSTGDEVGGFVVKDSGRRQTFESGMVRDTTEGKRDYTLALDGPMFDRWAEHLTKGARKYEARNWMLADGKDELERFRQSAIRHLLQWLRGDTDEDHAAAVFFNINGAEYVIDRMAAHATLLANADAVYAETPERAIARAKYRASERSERVGRELKERGLTDAYHNAVERVEAALGLDKCCMAWPACPDCTAPVDGGPE